jgi:hypothetical protein
MSIVETTPETRDDIETGGEYTAYHADVGRVMELLRPGDRVTLTRTSDAPAPHQVTVTSDCATGFDGESMDGAAWAFKSTGVPGVSPDGEEYVAVRGLVVEHIEKD